MNMFKTWGVKVLAATVALSVAPIAVPSSVPVVGVSEAHAQYYGEGRHWRGGPGYYRGDRGYYRDRGHYRGDRGYYRHRNNNGAAIAAGVIGLGIGAAIASAAQPRYVYRDSPRYVYRDDVVRYRPAPRAVYAGGRYEPWSRAWYNYCSARYRSFDGRSGTFQPYHGPRQFCR